MPVLAEQLRKYPFLRFLFPLILGVCLCDLFLNDTVRVRYVLVEALVIISLFFLLLYHYRRTYSKRWLFGVGVFLLFFGLGAALASYHLSGTIYEWPEQKTFYTAVINEKPQEKVNSFLCRVELTGCPELENVHFDSHRILLYLSKDSLSEKLRMGDELLFYGKITSPRNNGNPDEFDYARFLIHKGISGTAFIYSGDWKHLGTRLTTNLRSITSSWREQLLNYYSDLGFQGDNLAVLSALTLGYKEDLSEEIRESYSVAGASHVLALSGLHIGILYLLISFLLDWVKGGIVNRLMKLVLLILVLWAFAFISGLSPSVIRSATMFTIIAIARFYNARPISVNTIAIVAFLMILYDPFYIYDVSFQLSFVAVASIILIQPRLYRKVKVNSRLLKYIWGIMTTSIAAQVGTAPLVIYYFSRFSVYFLLTNLIVIPAVMLILYLAIAILSLSFLPALQACFVSGLQWVIALLNSFTSFVARIPFSAIDDINFTEGDVYGYYLMLCVFLFSFLLKKQTALLTVLSCLFALCLLRIPAYASLNNESSVLFYNIRSCPTVHFIQSREKSYLMAAENERVFEKLKLATARFWRNQKLSSPILLPADYEGNGIWSHDGITHFGGYTVCMVKDNSWKNKIADRPFLIDYMYICKGYQGKLESLLPVLAIKNVVLDSSLSDYRVNVLKDECRTLGLNFISLADKGALRIHVSQNKEYK